MIQPNRSPAQEVPPLPACFRRLPGAVLRLDAGGVVLDSNGVLERELGRELRGRAFVEALDADSSARKWERLLARSAAEAEAGDVVWELIPRGGDTPPEPRPFSVLWDAGASIFWVMEHRPDPRLDHLREQVTGVNSELVNTQRELHKERSRLTATVAELKAQYRKAELLARTVQEQNEELEAQNGQLLALTEELQARGEELERSNRALDEFAHVVSHDLKAPLRSISNYAAWLEEDLGEALAGESREHLERLRDRADRMRAMIEGVLQYARAGRERARPEPVDVGALLAGVVELLDPPGALEVALAPDMPVVRTERAPLQQVFLNLVGNAVRFAGRDAPRVRVRVRDAGGFHEFSVADNGPGIPARLQDRIWTLFHTLQPEGHAGGTGIGLAVVKKLVEAKGGRVWVESEEGAGATFRFLWPK
jgi:signal transduction histidine kinase